MADKDLVTKTYLEGRLEKFKKELRKEIGNDVITFFNTSVMPFLERMENKIDDINDITNTHERRLDKHDDKLIDHELRLKKLQIS